ncbi:MAG TPA: S8 family peptidase [Allocoleopsis sp.]
MKSVFFGAYFLSILSFSLLIKAQQERYVVITKRECNNTVNTEGYINSFKIGNLHGFITTNKSSVDYSNVVSIEEDIEIKINNNKCRPNDTLIQTSPTWGLDRIDQRNSVLDSKYHYNVLAGKDSNVFVIDTGVDVKHPEFEGRAIIGSNFIDDNPDDCNGHGTHVAGTIASKTYGVAKKTNIISIKVLDCSGSGTLSSLISGLEYAYNYNIKNKIVNMSLGASFSQAINSVVEQLTQNGVHVIVAAGNESADACNYSPASEPSAMTVKASDPNDSLTWFSNRGKCTDITAPGLNILSTLPNNSTGKYSGTSQATPHVSGVYALYVTKYGNDSPANIKNKITSIVSNSEILFSLI